MRIDVRSMVLAAVVLIGAVGPAAAAGTATAETTAATVDEPVATADIAAQQANCSFPTTATDATGTEVTIDAEPERVIALGAGTAQTLWEIGAKEKVVGMPVQPRTAGLAGAENRTGIYQSDGFTVATERVVGLDADVVLAANIIPNETVATLREAGLTVYKFGPATDLDDVYAKTSLTGRLVGACGAADRVADAMRTRVETIGEAVGNESAPSALYLQSGGFVAGNGTFIGDIVETAGADNLAATANITGYAEISDEVIAARDPEWIVTSNRSFVPEGEPWASTTAVRNDQVIVVGANDISQPAPRVVVPLTDLARAFHPDAIETASLTNATIGLANRTAANATSPGTTTASDAENTTATAGETTTTAAGTTAGATTTADATTAGEPTANATATDAGTDATDETTTAADTGTAANGSANATTTSSGNGPGFGPAVAVVAVLAATLLAAGRDGL